MTSALKEHNEGKAIRFEKQTFAVYIKRWLDETMKGAVAPRTWTRYEQLMRVHATPALGRLSLEKVTPQHIQRLYADVAGRGARLGRSCRSMPSSTKPSNRPSCGASCRAIRWRR
jgi:hypothetical protein